MAFLKPGRYGAATERPFEGVESDVVRTRGRLPPFLNANE